MSAKATQNQAILAALKAGKHLTNASARELCHTERLPARIHDLREQGHMIGDVWRKSTNMFGNRVRYKEYFMVKEADAEL